MIAASVALTVTAAVLFVVGLLSDGTGIIWGSIVASAAALGSLIAGVMRGRKATPATIGGVPVGEVPVEPAMREAIPVPSAHVDDDLTVSAEPFTVAESPSQDEEDEEETDEAEEQTDEGDEGQDDTVGLPVPKRSRAASPRKTPARKPAARKPAAKTAARKPAAKSAAKSTAKTATAKTATAKTTRKPAAKSATKSTAKTTTAKTPAKTTRKPAAKTTRKPAARKPTTSE